MTVKDWFSRCNRLDKRIDSLIQQSREEWERVTSITANLSGDVVDGTKDPHKYDGYAALQSAIDAEVDELYRIKNETKEVILQIPDRRYQDILDKRYISGESWERIAVEMNYTYRRVTQLHGEALEAAKQYIKNYG